MDRRRARLDHLLKMYSKKAEGLKYMGISVADLTKEELLAVAAYQNEKLTDFLTK